MKTFYISTSTSQVNGESVSGYAVLGDEGTCFEGSVVVGTNIATVLVIVNFLAANPALTDVTFRLRHKWALKAILEYLPTWASNGFKKADGKRVKHVEEWMALAPLVESRNLTFEAYDDQPIGQLAYELSKSNVDDARAEAEQVEETGEAEDVPPPIQYDVPPPVEYDAPTPVQETDEPVEQPSAPEAQTPKKVFVHGRGYASPTTIQYARKLLDRIEVIGAVLVTTDDTSGADRFLTVEAAKRGMKHVVVGIGEKPRASIGDSATYYQFKGIRPGTATGLALYQRNYAAAGRCDRAMIIGGDQRYIAKDQKFTARLKQDFGIEADFRSL